jgi:hypothetical protein
LPVPGHQQRRGRIATRFEGNGLIADADFGFVAATGEPQARWPAGFCCGGLVQVGGGIKCDQSVCLENLLSIMGAIAPSSNSRSSDDLDAMVKSLGHVGHFQPLVSPLENER